MKENEPCPYCQFMDGTKVIFHCGNENPDSGLICTRPKNHTGKHVACGDKHGHTLETWGEDDET